jgi:hypothetical protein
MTHSGCLEDIQVSARSDIESRITASDPSKADAVTWSRAALAWSMDGSALEAQAVLWRLRDLGYDVVRR